MTAGMKRSPATRPNLWDARGHPLDKKTSEMKQVKVDLEASGGNAGLWRHLLPELQRPLRRRLRELIAGRVTWNACDGHLRSAYGYTADCQ